MALQDLTPQLRTRLRKVEWFVVLFLGGTLVLMIASLAWFIKKTGDARGWWVTEVPYYTYLPNASGIKIGSPVQMIGFKVGQVTKVEAVGLEDLRSWKYYGDHPVFVGFNVREPYPGYITSDSQLKLAGLPIEIAGGVTLEVTVGSAAGLLTTTNGGGHLSVLSDKIVYDKLAEKPITNLQHYARYTPLAETKKGFFLKLDESDTMMAQVTRILAKLDGISGTVNDAMPGLTNELQKTLGNVRELTESLKPALANPGGIGALLLPTNLVARLDRPGGVGELLVPTNLNEELVGTLAAVRTNLPVTLTNLNQRMADLGPLLTNLTTGTARLGPLMTNVDDALGNVKSNTVPRVNSLLETLDSFVEGMKRHWLFRGAFKTVPTNAPPAAVDTNAPVRIPPPDRRRF
ncbi:MAG TPA: MlaD family protein [Candidatus Limnocylindria bacterium]|jgi:ABC-type transporter Mla subunit MlaD|nr:MlaD family protein [Candidatus Limnocylindria bacterium]